MASGVTAGQLFGLGLGPGDPELITLKALRLLRAAHVVAYPAPKDGDSSKTRPQLAPEQPLPPALATPKTFPDWSITNGPMGELPPLPDQEKLCNTVSFHSPDDDGDNSKTEPGSVAPPVAP